MVENVYLAFNGVSPYLLDSVARKLHADQNVSSFGATAFDRETKAWLDTESPVDYDPLYCVPQIREDRFPVRASTDRLQEIESRYGKPFLYYYVLGDPDTLFASHREQQRCLQGWFDFYENVLGRFEPDVFLTNLVDGGYVMIPFEVAKQCGATALWWKGTRIRNRYAILENTPYDQLTAVHALFERFQSGGASIDSFPGPRDDAKAFLDEFEDNGVKPGYYERREGTFGSRMRTLLRSLKASATGGESTFGPTNITSGLQDAVTKYRLARGLFERPRDDERYIFFPLHAQPEPSTGILAPMFLNQVSAIEQASRSLPITHKLYVKEHPRMFRDNPRDLDVFRTIDDLPNTRIIDVDVDAHALIEASDAVVTISGTPALEAALYGTPAITMGKAHFNVLSIVSHCPTPARLATVLEERLNDETYDDRELLQYLTALFTRSTELPADLLGMSRSEQTTAADRLFPLLDRHLP